MPESRGYVASKAVMEGGWVLELHCKGSCYSLGRLKNSTGTRERAGGKELDGAAVVPQMTMEYIYKSNAILHWTFIKDFLPSSLSCKIIIPCIHFDSVTFSSLLLFAIQISFFACLMSAAFTG